MKKYLLVLLLFAGCNAQKSETGSASRSIPVNIVHPSVEDVTFYVETIGTLHPKASAQIVPQTDGYVTAVHVKEGEYVKLGTPLFSLDQTLHKIQVQIAQAQLGMEEASLQGLQKKMVRYKSLAQKDLIAQTEWEELESQLEKARSSVDLHTANLHKTQIELEQCTVRSPIEGRVGNIPVSVGHFATAMTTHLTTITKADSIIVECSVTEKEFCEIPKESHRIEVSALSSPGSATTGTLTFFDSSFDVSRGVLLIKGLIEEPSMLPGQIVRVRIPTRTDSSVILLPQKAIRYNQKGPYVYTVSPEMTAAVTQIVLGDEHGTSRIVQAGLNANDSVIVDGHLRLSEGCAVTT